ncbi:ras association domain-containing 10-like isoform X3 [Brachionus plicatilis]|uniref:Ras association domain-containing 10-like isoform X3 n=1 Tax=Brachionus plicatilis TaxID=10195 RepID=A0A3M7PY73_BRAPC|nr:ras association domain-containing 10-like isoform X3 [Brachionus plicatilis]
MDTQRDCLDKIAIRVNGVERFATGLSKTTTIDQIKYAMLSVSEPGFAPDHNHSYGVFEKWHGHERLLEDKSKIYKVINFWKSLPGDQLSQVKFIIKKKKHGRGALRDKENLLIPECCEETDRADSHRLRSSLIDLVNRQAEFINGQVSSLSGEDDRVKCDDLREKILDAIELELVQSEKMEWLSDSLKQIDELIEMKREFVRKMEGEMSDQETEIRIFYEPNKSEVVESSERPVVSVMSTTTSSSIFTSVSSTSTTENYAVVKDSLVAADAVIVLETLV